MALKLYGVPLSPFARMAHAVAELTNNEVEYVKESLPLGHSPSVSSLLTVGAIIHWVSIRSSFSSQCNRLSFYIGSNLNFG